MEKRFVIFLVLSLTILTGYGIVREFVLPSPAPEPVAQRDAPPIEPEEGTDEEAGDEVSGDGTDSTNQPDSENSEGTPTEPAATADAPTLQQAADATEAGTSDSTTRVNTDSQPEQREQEWISVGSYEPESGAPLLITFNNRGAAVDRIELTERTANGRLRFLNLGDNSGYLGHLALSDDANGNCRINVVGDATPAAKATASTSGIPSGLKVGDLILEVEGRELRDPVQLEDFLHETTPGQTISLTVDRLTDGGSQEIEFSVELGARPLQLIRPGPSFSETGQGDQASMLLSLVGLGEKRVKPGDLELESVASLRTGFWEVADSGDPSVVEFRFPLELQDESEGASERWSGIEIVKRYRLGSRADFESLAESDQPYHIDLEVEIRNQSEQPQDLVYRLDGPNGLPLEGWWYSNKIHPTMFYVAGARDVVWQLNTGGFHLLGASAIFKSAKKDSEKSPETVLFTGDKAQPDRAVDFTGVDSQYFLAAFAPGLRPDGTAASFDRAAAYHIGDLEEIPRGAQKTTNVSFYLNSTPIRIEPGESFGQSFVVYTGPKIPSVLSAYGLENAIYYGWFGAVSRLLATVLHFFYQIVHNYGLAIVLLTVMVRSCMFPLSRKAAKNAAMMQELAPEMKKIAEKYKNDMEKRGKAQQELFKKHNYNPFSGCWMMFLQLPIFIGLYRCLSVDIELRQAALIPGIQWASNLAGPDKLFEWRGLFGGWSMFTEVGMLGPYFNILPIFTIVLFLMHQKLFTPPATDEQTRMQMTMMKYMTVFIGVMFFKVPAGLCLYFIASSLWGIAERKLLPKSAAQKAAAEAQKTAAKKNATGDNGTSRSRPERSVTNGSGKQGAGSPARAKRRKRKN